MKKLKVYKSEIPKKRVIIPGDSSELPDDSFKKSKLIIHIIL